MGIIVACSQIRQTEIPDPTSIPQTTDVELTQPLIPTNTPTIQPTQTHVKVLSYQEKLDRVLELEISNGGCSFPCWWGITPGVTTWDEFTEKLIPLTVENLKFRTSNGEFDYYLEFPFQPENIVVHVYVKKDRQIDVIRVAQEDPVENLFVHFGQPSEIWVSSDGIVPGPSFFTLAPFYPEKGLMVAYRGKSNLIYKNGVQYLNTCLADFNSVAVFWLWNPNEKKDFKELPIEFLTGKPPAAYKLEPIEKYTNYDEISFYETVIGSLEKACLQTQADIWPILNN